MLLPRNAIFRRLQRRRLRFHRPPRWLYPAGIERAYMISLVKMVRAIEDEVRLRIVPQLSGIVARANLTTDSVTRKDQWETDVTEMVQGIRHLYPSMTRNVTLGAQTVGQAVDAWNSAQWRKITKNTLGMDILTAEPWLKDVLAGFNQQNISLVTGLTDDLAAKLEQRILNGVLHGRTAESISRSILEGSKDEDGLMTMSRNRAEFIARDQIGKLNGQLTHFRQTSIGVEHYLWRTMLDGKVRAKHLAREGKRFSWDNPPDGGSPGEDYNCRCYAEPDFTDIADELPEDFFGEE